MGSVQQLIKFITNLASLIEPIGPLLQEENITNIKMKWEASHTIALENIKTEISKVTEKKTIRQAKKLLTRMRCKSYRPRGSTRATIPRGVVPLLTYASGFLNEAELKYSTYELELLSVVWTAETFKYYQVGSTIALITDHTALLSALKSNRGNKSRQSRLTSWLGR